MTLLKQAPLNAHSSLKHFHGAAERGDDNQARKATNLGEEPAVSEKKASASSDVSKQYRTFDVPPKGFDPLTASDASLLRYGLPRRPDPTAQPRLARLWKDAFSRPMTFIKPELTFQPRTRRLPLAVPGPPVVLPGSWGGVQLFSQPNAPFQMVFGQWVIPTVLPVQLNDPLQTITLGFWVGLDGAAQCGLQILQAGVAAVASADPSLPVEWYAWTEWFTAAFNDPAAKVTNFPVSPGDSVSFLVCAPEPNIGFFSMINHSRNHYSSHSIHRSDGIALTGCSAEWVLEPQTNTQGDTELLDFYAWEVTNCAAASATQLYDLQSGVVFTEVVTDIYVAPLVPITETTVETPTSVIVRQIATN